MSLLWWTTEGRTESSVADEKEWSMPFNGSAMMNGGAKVVLYATDETNISPVFKFDFPCSNTEAEYEAVFIDLLWVVR